MYPQVEIADQALPLGLGDVLLLWTDGVTERRDGPDMFGEERLREVFSAVPAPPDASATVRSVAAAVDAFGTSPPQDDIAILAIRILEHDHVERVA
jgi:serine phosphatase RsbU (regulator of sigma subunit)